MPGKDKGSRTSRNIAKEWEWKEGGRGGGDGIYLRVAVRPRMNCLIKEISKVVDIESFVPGYGDKHPDQIIIKRSEHSELAERYPLRKIIETRDGVIYRLLNPKFDFDENSLLPSPISCDTCDNSGCRACEFKSLPIIPYELCWKDGQLHLMIALSTQSEFQKFLSTLNELPVDIDLLQIVHGNWNQTNSTVHTLIDLSSLTMRQREVAKRAVEMGYFDRQGASAETVAAELDISKSTLSKHLRIVTERILSQIFGI